MTPPRLASLIEEALSDSVRLRAKEVGEKVKREEEGVGTAIGVVERFLSGVEDGKAFWEGVRREVERKVGLRRRRRTVWAAGVLAVVVAVSVVVVAAGGVQNDRKNQK